MRMQGTRDIGREKMLARSKLLMWELSHGRPEDKQLLADVEELIYLSEMAAYRDGMRDGIQLFEALALEDAQENHAVAI
jgi:hypothetical protein